VTFAWGRGQNNWGRGERGTLGLSSYSSPMDYLKIETAFWRLRFIFMTAALKQYPPVAQNYYPSQPGEAADSVAVQKRFSGQRLEIDLPGGVALGFYETVVYCGRYEWSYLNPLMFLKGAEHTNGDHDNAAMGADFRWLPGCQTSIYGEFFIDDITTSKLGTDWYGNKLAWQTGIMTEDPFGIDDTDIRLEYTRINPWVYTHRLSYNSYTHYGDVIGHEIGPNSDLATMTVRKRFLRRFHTSFSASYHRHGENPDGVNVGGDPLDGFSNGDSIHARFLAGTKKRITRYEADIAYELFWQCYLRAGYTYERFNDDGVSIFRVSFGLNE
jgi:hypothetical protein